MYMGLQLFILGNGFDMAHGLKTGYGDFIKNIIIKSINYDMDIREYLIDVGYLSSNRQTYDHIKINYQKLFPSRLTDEPKTDKIIFRNDLLLNLLWH